jgi:hypothetical protein
MAKRKKSQTVEESGIRVRVFQRGGRYWLDVRNGEDRTRVSANTTDRSQAEANAKSLAREIATRRLLGVSPDTLTLGQLFTAYDEHRGSKFERVQWRTAIKTRTRLFLEAWGGDIPVVSISQTSVDSYSAKRRADFVEKQRSQRAAREIVLAERAKVAGKKHVRRPALGFRDLRDGAIDPDFRWLSSVFNWAMRHRLSSGKRLLTVNPLHDCKWPREKSENIRRPPATHDRYVRTLAQCDAIDPSGRFRVALTLARYTARRIDAILHLRASDVLLKKRQIRAALGEAGHDEGLAETMKHGAIRWRRQYDKQRIERITPIAQMVKDELEGYLERHARIGDAFLLPAADDPELPLPRSTATKWLEQAERVADLPKLRGGLWHSYRRLWATERKHLPDVDVAEAGGWTGTKAMKLAYQGPTASGVLAAVMNG